MNKKFICDKCGEIDYVLFDGYSFGERILENVYFKAYYENEELKVDLCGDWNDPYCRQLNKEYWMGLALDWAKNELDIAECPKCREDVDGTI